MSESTDIRPKQFDYCEIKFEIERDEHVEDEAAVGRFIGQFVAYATSPLGDYIDGKSPPIRIKFADEIEGFEPDKLNGKHQNVLRILLTSLQAGGWELLEATEGELWYARRLQKPTPIVEEKKLRPRERIGISLAIITAILLFAYVVTALYRPFTNGVRAYMELEVIESEVAPYRTGKFLIVNPYPVPITHPLRGRPDTLHWQLPDELRAEKYDDIRMVVWNACRYPVRLDRLETICRVSVIDLETLELVAYQEFPSEPVATVPLSERDATRDEAGILEFLLSLPEK